MEHRVLSVRQPWASLIASGRKTIELRSWSTSYRGPVLIVSGSSPWRGRHGYPLGPMGVAICWVDLVDVRPYSPEDRAASAVPGTIDLGDKPLQSWILANPRPVAHVPVRGKLGLYRPDPTLLQAVSA